MESKEIVFVFVPVFVFVKKNLRPPGGGGHGEQGEEQEGGVEQGEEVGVGSGPELRANMLMVVADNLCTWSPPGEQVFGGIGLPGDRSNIMFCCPY